MKNIILASQSPRRRELLTQIGLEFEVHPAGGEEIITSTDPVEVVKSLSTQKAAAVKEELEGQLPENWLVIGADTIVVYDGKILGKPKDEADAICMLTMLQGQTHSVYTGVTLLEEGKQTTFAEETKVSMYPFCGLGEGNFRGLQQCGGTSGRTDLSETEKRRILLEIKMLK